MTQSPDSIENQQGIAPTLMIARVAMLENGGRNRDAAGAPHISGLQFRNTQGSDASYEPEDVEPMRVSRFAGDLHEIDKEQ